MPQQLLREMFELDADFAEALWALDQPPNALDFKAMLRDTLAALKNLPVVQAEFLAALPGRSQAPLEKHRKQIRSGLTRDHAYLQVPGRDPEIG